MSAAMSSRSCAICWKSVSRRCAIRRRREVEAQAEARAEERILDALVGEKSSQGTREFFRKMLRAGELNDREVELEMHDSGRA